ncbi:Phenylalanyl-tRNA synthetase [Boeremia exigua]|uniref:Phenylalanyl-tRNA synthetase n=1 Tax=Boeremia exigua TaxID=749465 RepID=UPI001E8E9A1D|nr:Phenylalanyl-tRNA synthetase [Boeremia exigua]KAH6625906.1 Phenylalanyl-tRNA synthetase [Boeremia exigua]
MPVTPALFLEGAKVSPDIFKLRPDYRALLLIVEGIPQGPSDAKSEALLQEAELSARSALSKHAVTEVPHVAAWRDAYKSFGAKPKKERSSLESLMRRAEGGLPRVNRLTDIYNAISVKHQIPFGGEDLDKYSGLPFLIRATGQEKFETSAAGERVTEYPPAGEVVWCDDAGVTCRRWNWRQCSRTGISDSTTRVLFILDALEPCEDSSLEAAADELVAVLRSLSSDVSASRRLIQVS